MTLRTQPASLVQEAVAWAITLLYLFIIVLIVLLMRYAFAQKPFGRLVSNDGGGGEEFARARRGLAGLLHPSVVLSRQMGLDPGLIFRFHRGNRITVAGDGVGRRAYRLGGDPVPTSPVAASESLLTTSDGGMSYTVTASSGDDFDEDFGARRGGLLRRQPANDDEEEYSGRRGLFGRRARADDYDNFDDDRTSRRKSRRTRDDYDDEDYGSARRGRSRDAYDDLDDGYSSSKRGRKSRRRDDDDY